MIAHVARGFFQEFEKLANDAELTDFQELGMAERAKRERERDNDPRNRDPLGKKKRFLTTDDDSENRAKIKRRERDVDDGADAGDHTSAQEMA